MKDKNHLRNFRAAVCLAAVVFVVFVVASCGEKAEEIVDAAKPPEEVLKVAFSPTETFDSDDTINGLPLSSRGLMNLLESPDSTLDEEALKTALDYLYHPQPAETSADPAAEYFNNIMAILLAQKGEVDGFTEGLFSVASNEKLPLLLRDYAMQHFYHAWLREKDTSVRQDIESRVMKHYQDAESPLQSVAILTASRFVDQDVVVKGPNGEKLKLIGEPVASKNLNATPPTQFNRNSFVVSATKTINNTSANPSAKVSALNVLIRLGESQVVNSARSLLKSKKTADSVKCSALAVMGAFGDLKLDRATLDAVPVTPTTVRAAADIAMRRLQQN